MAIHLNGKTKLTSEGEKLFIELGGGDPEATLSRDELSKALGNAVNILAERRSPLLLKLYRSIVPEKGWPPLEDLGDFPVDGISQA